LSIPLYPLRFREILRDYRFGDRWIVEAYQKTGLPENHRVTLIDTYGAALLGEDIVARCGKRFPLLIKFLDASHNLGEQAHHDDEQAAKHGLFDPGKTEAWYMLKVRDGAMIRCGNKPGATVESVRDALLAGTIKEEMRAYEVVPGDAFLLYGGTMHCGDGGTLFYEVMQNSDVYISLRAPDPALSVDVRATLAREAMEMLHIEDGFDSKTEPITLGGGANRRTFVFACRYFALERLDLMAPTMLNCDGSRFFVLSLIEGACTVVHGDHYEKLLPGQTVMLPAGLGYVTLVPTEPCSVLKTYVPDLAKDIIKPLRTIGILDAAIVGLGGKTVLNDLAPLLEAE